VSFLKRFFGPKSVLDSAAPRPPSQASASQSARPQPPADPGLVAAMTKVGELEVRLGRYYQTHPVTENESLVDIAYNLGANNSALLYVVGLAKSEFGDDQIRTLLTKLEGTGRMKGLEESLVPQLKESLQGIRGLSATSGEQLRQTCARKLMVLLNMYFDVGTKFLLQREMKDNGFSDALINRALKTESPNVF